MPLFNQQVPGFSAVRLSSKGGTKISTITPFTTLESSVYNSLTRVFINDAMAANATRVTGVAPFKICFSTKVNNGAVIRPDEQVFWRIFETNAMVPVADGVACLGFLDGGLNAGSAIVIGGYQLEDNLLQFDLVSSRLGFTSSLLLRETSCDSFNFRS
ncbi:hypothetical protein RJ639_016725 [Escallonia herrerae]|uniref:Peptidase A1 domain-containing protein n=1 Tax=Escallonia herrerae TaxID=1293975 RepID=A0AA89AJB2_9ASTE|nr:hypothetical protein RJ639_016725 [Escallonia herrerae]